MKKARFNYLAFFYDGWLSNSVWEFLKGVVYAKTNLCISSGLLFTCNTTLLKITWGSNQSPLFNKDYKIVSK